MEAKELIDFLGKAEKLKSVPRHCVTSDGVVENVAAHSWRLALMAFLLKDELGEINIDRVIRMCLVHDLGEAVTGDIPTFEKTGEHEEIEKLAVDGLRLVAVEQGKVIAAGKLGKIKTCTQMAMLVAYLLSAIGWLRVPALNWTLLAVAMAMTLWSGVDYFWKNRALFAGSLR